ncbi:MAG TPA: HupE/UreJ family protein [Planctomycetota bacterium]|nr:HupE/UreJ family protein [Planctomycetota bacterium]
MRVALAAAALLTAALPARAHDDGATSHDVRVGSREIVWTVDAGVLELARVVRIEGFTPRLTELREERLRAAAAEIGEYLRAGLRLRVNGRDALLETGPLEPVYEALPPTDLRLLGRVRQQFRFRSDEEIRRIELGTDLFTAIVPSPTAMFTIRWDGKERQEVVFAPAELRYRAETFDPRWWVGALQFVRWGVHHIFIGYDHMAFLLALLLGTTRFKDLLKIVTSFTAAHSLTLLLSALDVVRVPGRLTEALIAASIVYVAIENFFVSDGRRRWLLTFGFGLVHGLGFSTNLKELLTDRVVVPVLSFNLGVELGQVAILAATFPALAWLRRTSTPDRAAPLQRRLAWAGSVPLLLLGLGWLVERAVGLEFMPL